MLCRVWQSADYMILVSIVIRNQTVDFPEIHEET